MAGACLVIRTGLQGNGKTLNTIKEVDIQAKREGRIVYYHNVTDLDPSKLQAQWFEFEDPKKWFELPNDSIVVIDEAQGWFGARDPRAQVPEHLSRFETMRKQGHEVHLITQDPRFLDVHARRLCNLHIHYWRIFGSSKVSRYEMPRVKDDVEKLANFKDASRTTVTLDKRYFGVYSSAQAQHHFKFKPSRKAVFFLFAFLVALVFFWRAYDMVFGRDQPVPPTASVAPGAAPGAVDQAVSAAKSLLPGIAPTGAASEKPKTKAEWLAARTPRIPDDPASAPIYDDLTKPKSYPRLSCVASDDQELLQRARHRMQVRRHGDRLKGCQCYTQQGSRYQTSFAYCLNVVSNGYFDPVRPDSVLQQAQQAQQVQHVQQAQQAQQVQQVQQSPQQVQQLQQAKQQSRSVAAVPELVPAPPVEPLPLAPAVYVPLVARSSAVGSSVPFDSGAQHGGL